MNTQFLIREDDEYTVDRFQIRDYMKENNLETIYVISTWLDPTNNYIFCEYHNQTRKEFGCFFLCDIYKLWHTKDDLINHVNCEYMIRTIMPDFRYTFRCVLNKTKNNIKMELIIDDCEPRIRYPDLVRNYQKKKEIPRVYPNCKERWSKLAALAKSLS